jgi:O-antigen/teichoic acid export membrane protein
MSPSAVTADGAPRAGGSTTDHGVKRRLLTLTGGRVTRHTLIYIVGMLAVGPFSLVSVVVLTRLLVPGQYGEMGVLFVFAGFATVLYNTGSLHGTFMLVYGASEGEGDDVSANGTITSTPRRALGTGVVLTLMIVTVGTAICFVLAPALAQLLLHRRSGAALVRWAAVSAAAGSLWRLTINVFRMERRPEHFAFFNATRPLFVVAGSVPLVALGFGVGGAIAGTALGTIAATAVCIAMARRSYALAFCWSDVKEIVRRGSLVVIPVVCLYSVHSTDILLLSRFAGAHELGIYRVASRFATLPSYFASALLMAWSPLELGVLFRATYRHVGKDRVRGAILTYYLLIATTIVVLLDVFGNVLVLLVGSKYRQAAPLIPLIGVAFVCYGLYIVLARAITVERHMLWFSLGAVAAAVLQIGLSVVTIPWLGAYGAPLAMTLGLLVGCLMWVVLAMRAEVVPLSLTAKPLAGLAAAVATALTIQGVGLSIWPGGRAVILALTLASYVITVAALGVIPRRHFKLLSQLARAALHKGLGGNDPTVNMGLLDPRQRSLITVIERDGVPTVVLAERLNRTESEIQCEYVSILRQLIGARPTPSRPAELDIRLANYLLSREPLAQRDLIGNELIEDGEDALELMELDEAAQRLRALPSRAWTTWITEPPSREHRVHLSALAEHLADLPASHRRAALAILRDGRTPAQAAAETGVSEHLAAARTVRVLRRVGGLGTGGPSDASIGMALFNSPPSATRPPEARATALVYDRVRGFSRLRWRRAIPAQWRRETA